MSDEDKLLGIAKNGRSTERTYSAYRIDYDSTDAVTDLLEEGESFTGATKNPPAGYPGHEAKTDYQRKVLVEDSTTRDEVVALLEENNIAYVDESVEPTEEDKKYIEDFGAESSLDGKRAMEWKRMLEDLEVGNISQVDVERGRNPHTEEHPGRPNPGNGKGNGNGPNN
jgi:hypothetical protein